MRWVHCEMPTPCTNSTPTPAAAPTDATDEAIASELMDTMECEESEEVDSDESGEDAGDTEEEPTEKQAALLDKKAPKAGDKKRKAKSVKNANNEQAPAKKKTVVARPFKNLSNEVLDSRLRKLHARSMGFRKKIEFVRTRRRAFEREMKLRDIEYA